MTVTSTIAKTDQDSLVISDQPLTIKALKNMIGGPTLPKRWKTVSEAITAVKYGEELGLAPLESLYRLYMVNGGLACDAKSLSALIHRAGHYLTFDEMTPKVATVTAIDG